MLSLARAAPEKARDEQPRVNIVNGRECWRVRSLPGQCCLARHHSGEVGGGYVIAEQGTPAQTLQCAYLGHTSWKRGENI